jgi:hypothetical protein
VLGFYTVDINALRRNIHGILSARKTNGIVIGKQFVSFLRSFLFFRNAAFSAQKFVHAHA